MTDDYNLAKPDPTAPLPPGDYTNDPSVYVNQQGALVRVDLSGFRPGIDRMKTAPEFLADRKRNAPPLADVTAFGEDTLFKVREGLRQVLGSEQVITDCIAEMQNQGILFRETAVEETDRGSASDGYHTFNELYDHRRALTAALLSVAPWFAWRSKSHHPDDTPIYDGMFIVGLDLPQGTITYHYNLEHWDDFSEITEIPYPLKWDGAPPAETVTRLLAAARGK